ncbi:uncharacterized protein LOC133140145 isoform X1 [Conger conger]|uniref:uncharacterized protein LOC133140145 isoform X1 n=1 Tax=Conger conger TaxID=82655 RepID=UPI002A5A0C1A|nr:uncharacterized protein LOC133140145 isoform X1 [Conger conger]
MTGQILTVGGLKALLGKVVGMETMLDIFKQAGFVRAQVQPPAVDSGPFDNVHAAQVEADNRKGLNTMTHREFVDHVVHTVERQRKEEKSWKIKQKTFKENYCAAEGAGSQRTKAPPTPEPWSSPMVPRPAVVYNFSGIPHPVAMQAYSRECQKHQQCPSGPSTRIASRLTSGGTCRPHPLVGRSSRLTSGGRCRPHPLVGSRRPPVTGTMAIPRATNQCVNKIKRSVIILIVGSLRIIHTAVIRPVKLCGMHFCRECWRNQGNAVILRSLRQLDAAIAAGDVHPTSYGALAKGDIRGHRF